MLTKLRTVTLITAAVTAIGCNLSHTTDTLVGKFASAALHSVLNRAAAASAAQSEKSSSPADVTADAALPAHHRSRTTVVAPPARIPPQSEDIRDAALETNEIMTVSAPRMAVPPSIAAMERRFVFVNTAEGHVHGQIPELVRLRRCMVKANAESIQRIVKEAKMAQMSIVRSQEFAHLSIDISLPPDVPMTPEMRTVVCPNRDRARSSS
ncbi:MAG TPA: hypothetical protein VHL58_07835 [Thermoanaerobaculia bacterium]|nr:hypothetical protein [Thermoanaerobaculia bacterium]